VDFRPPLVAMCSRINGSRLIVSAIPSARILKWTADDSRSPWELINKRQILATDHARLTLRVTPHGEE
jgi:hypothetical protein